MGNSRNHTSRSKDLPREIKDRLGSSDYRGGYVDTHLSMFGLIVFPQPRRSFFELEELGLDIAQNGQLYPLIVARFNRSNFERYIEVINRIWKTGFTVEEAMDKAVVEHGEMIFYVLLAGERRYRSCRLVWAEGCEDCLATHGPEEPGVCFTRHRKGPKLKVSLAANISPLAALYLQYRENVHMRVPIHEEAHALDHLFRLIREVNGDFSIAAFARGVNRSPQKIRDAVRFCNLPDSIKDSVEKGEIAYGIALVIAGIKELLPDVNDTELEDWFLRAITSNYKVSEFRGVVAKYIQSVRSGQISLLEVMSEEQVKAALKPQYRKVVEVHMVRMLWSQQYYLKRVMRLFEEGKLGEKDSPFSDGSPLRLLRSNLQQMGVITSLIEDQVEIEA